MTSAETKAEAGRYELLDDLWEEVTSPPDAPFLTTKRHVRGDIVELDEANAERMLATNSVAPEGAVAQAEAEALQAQYLAVLNQLPVELRAQLAQQALTAAIEPTAPEDLTVHTAAGFTNEGHPRYAQAAQGEGAQDVDGEVGTSLTDTVLDDGTRAGRTTTAARAAAVEELTGQSATQTAEQTQAAEEQQEQPADESSTSSRKRSSS
jgi:hypothetical protein